LPCTHLAHHELESFHITIVVVVIVVVVLVVVIIAIVVIMLCSVLGWTQRS